MVAGGVFAVDLVAAALAEDAVAGPLGGDEVGGVPDESEPPVARTWDAKGLGADPDVGTPRGAAQPATRTTRAAA